MIAAAVTTVVAGLFVVTASSTVAGLFAASTIPAVAGLFAVTAIPAVAGLFVVTAIPAVAGLFAAIAIPAVAFARFSAASFSLAGFLFAASFPFTGFFATVFFPFAGLLFVTRSRSILLVVRLFFIACTRRTLFVTTGLVSGIVTCIRLVLRHISFSRRL